MARSLENVLREATRALVLGMGGGGDVVGALATGRLAESFGCEFVVGGTLWERLPNDPEPGPRPLDAVRDVRRLNSHSALAGPDTRSESGVIFAESHMAGFLGRQTLVVDVLDGPAATAASLADAAEQLGADLVAFVDVGGDVLADGSEPGLASPLCDAVMLAAAAMLGDTMECVAAVFGPACDGELTQVEILANIALVARAGGWLGTWGLSPGVADELERAIAVVPTEVSAQAVRCARGDVGATSIRRGHRRVELSPIGALTFYLDPRTARDTVARVAQAVSDAGSLEEANHALHAIGVRTELDWERESTER